MDGTMDGTMDGERSPNFLFLVGVDGWWWDDRHSKTVKLKNYINKYVDLAVACHREMHQHS
jgi:hypothetical protein